MNALTILVAGATGTQGNAVARHLLTKGHRVRALTRTADAPAAIDLGRLGAEIVRGDLTDKTSVELEVQDADAVFAMTTPFGSNIETEVLQGITVADVAKTAGVGHLVFSSVQSAERGTGIPHFDSKYEIERHIRAAGVPHTILAPAYFMENATAWWSLPSLRKGFWSRPLPAARTVQQVAVSDLAALAVLAFDRRDSFLGRRVDVASDELSGADEAAVLSRTSGAEIGYAEVPLEETRADEDQYVMWKWLGEVGFNAETGALRREYPEVGWRTYESWAREQDWDVLRRASEPDDHALAAIPGRRRDR